MFHFPRKTSDGTFLTNVFLIAFFSLLLVLTGFVWAEDVHAEEQPLAENDAEFYLVSDLTKGSRRLYSSLGLPGQYEVDYSFEKEYGVFEESDFKEISINAEKGVLVIQPLISENEEIRNFLDSFLYLEITTPAGKKYLKKMSQVEELLIESEGEYKFRLISLRKERGVQEGYVPPPLGDKSMIVVFSKVQVDVRGQYLVWDKSIAKLFGKDKRLEFLANRGTLIEYTDSLSDDKYLEIKTEKKGRVVLLNESIKLISDERNQSYVLAEIGSVVKRGSLLNYLSLLLFLIFLAFLLYYFLTFAKNRTKYIELLRDKYNFFWVVKPFLKFFGIYPVDVKWLSINIFLSGLLVFSLFQWVPHWILISGPNDYLVSEEGKQFSSLAQLFYLTVETDSPSEHLSDHFAVKSESNVYLRSISNPYSFVDSSYLLSLPGVNWSEEFAVANSSYNNDQYTFYTKEENVTLEKSDNIYIDPETVDMHIFFNNVLVKGDIFDKSFATPKQTELVNSFIIDIYGMSKFGTVFYIDGENERTFDVSITSESEQIDCNIYLANMEIYSIRDGLLEERAMFCGLEKKQLTLSPGFYYLTVSTLRGDSFNLEVSDSSEERSFALDWSLFGHRPNLLSEYCPNKQFLLIDSRRIGGLFQEDDCLTPLLLDPQNKIENTHTSGLLLKHFSTDFSKNTDALVVGSQSKRRMFSGYSVYNVYSRSSEKLDFESEFTLGDYKK